MYRLVSFFLLFYFLSCNKQGFKDYIQRDEFILPITRTDSLSLSKNDGYCIEPLFFNSDTTIRWMDNKKRLIVKDFVKSTLIEKTKEYRIERETITAKLFYYYNSGGVKAEIGYLKNDKHGVFKFYKEDGSIFIEEHWEKGVLKKVIDEGDGW